MKSQYIVREFDNAAIEIVYTTLNLRKITYDTGDVVYFDRTVVGPNNDLRGAVVKIITHDGITIGNYDTASIDNIPLQTQGSFTQEAIQFNRQKRVLKNLQRDRHHYDRLLSAFIACRRCKGTGEIHTNQDVGEWENEGGSIVSKPCECGGEKTRITEDIVKRFFDIPMPSKDIRLVATRSGACGFDINIYATQNPALQDDAMRELEALLSDNKNAAGVYGVYPAKIDYETGISYRHFAGEVKVCQSIVSNWFKACAKKMGSNRVSVSSHMQL